MLQSYTVNYPATWHIFHVVLGKAAGAISLVYTAFYSTR